MSGQVVFALTAQQASVLRKLNGGRGDFTDAERIAFYALARRGLVRGSPDELQASPAWLTHTGHYAAFLVVELQLATAEPPAGTFGRGIERRQGDRRGGRVTPIDVTGEPACHARDPALTAK